MIRVIGMKIISNLKWKSINMNNVIDVWVVGRKDGVRVIYQSVFGSKSSAQDYVTAKTIGLPDGMLNDYIIFKQSVAM